MKPRFLVLSAAAITALGCSYNARLATQTPAAGGALPTVPYQASSSTHPSFAAIIQLLDTNRAAVRAKDDVRQARWIQARDLSAAPTVVSQYVLGGCLRIAPDVRVVAPAPALTGESLRAVGGITGISFAFGTYLALTIPGC